MTTVTLMLVNSNLLSEFYFTRSASKLAAKLIANGEYQEFTIESDKTGEDAAEDIFDLTNNPYRQEEREVKYGRGRSMSVGDIVEVDGTRMICSPVGFEVLLEE